MWRVVWIAIVASFLVPGGFITVFFAGILLTPLWLLLLVLWAYWQAFKQIH